MILRTHNFDTATVTHPGHVRKVNEDAVYVNPRRGIWLVADGMGGHRDGGIASSMIVEAVKNISDSNSVLSDLLASVEGVNEKLLQRSNGLHEHIVGSTVNVLIVEGRRYTCLWAGDSRCYLARGGTVKQLSQDHTEVQELVNSGAITKQEALTWPRRNVITRAIGVDRDLELDAISGEIENGDCFILCSDGLTGHVSDDEILAMVRKYSPKIACDELLNLALQRGGKDNISIIIAQTSKADSTIILESGSNGV
jgi:serine/threonine protein phosphatase PrpC